MYKGQKKLVTFSYDDGVTQDVRLTELFHRHGLRATFNINSALLGMERGLRPDGVLINHSTNKPEDIKHIYEGHEVAVHTLTHPRLTTLPDEEIYREVEEDRLRLSELVGYEVLGMAYPCGGVNCDDRVARVIRERTPIRYARTVATTGLFTPDTDLHQYRGTIYHHGEWGKLPSVIDEFLSLKTDECALLYIWGHAYEFDIYPERWAQFEEYCGKLGGHDDIYYGTNLECFRALGLCD